jgi:hypothetical protein
LLYTGPFSLSWCKNKGTKSLPWSLPHIKRVLGTRYVVFLPFVVVAAAPEAAGRASRPLAAPWHRGVPGKSAPPTDGTNPDLFTAAAARNHPGDYAARAPVRGRGTGKPAPGCGSPSRAGPPGTLSSHPGTACARQRWRMHLEACRAGGHGRGAAQRGCNRAASALRMGLPPAWGMRGAVYRAPQAWGAPARRCARATRRAGWSAERTGPGRPRTARVRRGGPQRAPAHRR